MSETFWAATTAAFADAGCGAVFGVPTDEPGLLDAAAASDRIAAFPVRDQRAGASHACGYAKVSGRPVVLALSSGPSFLNALAGISEAASLGTPLIVVTTRIPASGIGRGGFQELDQRTAAASIAGWVHCVERLEDVSWSVHRAVALARTARPSVTVLEFTDEVARLGPPPADTAVGSTPEPRAVPCDEDLERAVDLMRSARRPLVVAGAGAGAAVEPLRDLMSVWGAAGATTSAGRGAIDEHDDMACGLVGLYATPPLQEVFSAADVVLGVGTRWEETATMGWDGLSEARVIHIDRDVTAFNQSVRTEAALHGDAALTVGRLVELLSSGPEPVTDPEFADTVRDAVEAARRRCGRDSAGSSCATTLRCLQERLPAGFVLAQDNGLHDIWSYHFPLLRVRAGGTVIGPGEQTVMGHGLAAGVGAALAEPERVTVAVTGDGAFSMSASSLAVAAEHGCRLLAVVFDDGGFGWPRLLRSAEDRPCEVTVFGGGSSVAGCARAYGAEVATVGGMEELEECVERLLAVVREGRPAVLHVPVRDDDVPPGVKRVIGLPD